MGVLMKEDDIYIGSMLELLNLRFAPADSTEDGFGGLDEMVELQKEFNVFKAGRRFRDSAAVLNLGGYWNKRAKNRWFRLLELLRKFDSTTAGLDGDQCIVQALVDNLTAAKPVPVYFKAHDLRGPDGKKVIVKRQQAAVFFIDQPFLSISLPMEPRAADRAQAPAKKKAAKKKK